MFGRKKPKTKLQQARASAESTLHSAQETIHDVLEAAPEKFDELKHTAGDALHGASETLQDAAARLAGVASSAVGTLGHKADTLKDKAESLRGTAAQSAQAGASTLSSTLHERADAVLDSARALKKQRARQAKELERETKQALQKKKEELVVAHAPEVVIESGSQKWLWLFIGVGIGALLGILLAPNSGRRTRAAIKDKVGRGSSAVGSIGESVSSRAHDLSNRAAGAAHEFATQHSGEGNAEEGDDGTIADRVRSELGHLTVSHGLERINVDSCDGIVTLRGPVGAQAIADELVAATGKVLGVREVKNELTISSDGEAFVG